MKKEENRGEREADRGTFLPLSLPPQGRGERRKAICCQSLSFLYICILRLKARISVICFL